jgi:type III restriction enzyme
MAYTYRGKDGRETPGYPDFVIFRADGDDVLVDLLEPHQGKDALAKAQGLCTFAEKHGDKFGRIEYITIDGTRLKRLNLNATSVRREVMAIEINSALDTLFNPIGTAESIPA